MNTHINIIILLKYLIIRHFILQFNLSKEQNKCSCGDQQLKALI